MGHSPGLDAAAIFVRVVEAGSLRAAARNLGMPKSSVSRRLAALEQDLGVRLLQRTTRRLSLTDAGTAYLRGATQALSALSEAADTARNLHAEPKGALRVTAPVSFGTQVAPGLVSRFLQRYPEVSLTLELTDRFVDLVTEGFDVAVRAGVLPDSSLIAYRLATAQIVTAASPRYLAAHGTPRAPDDVSDHACLLHGTSTTGRWSFLEKRSLRNVTVHGRFASTSFALLARAAEEGYGLVRLPLLAASASLESGALVRVLERFDPPEVAMHAVVPSRQHVPAKVRAFIEEVEAELATLPESAVGRVVRGAARTKSSARATPARGRSRAA